MLQLAAHLEVCGALEYLDLGDSDTGNGVWVTDKGVTALAAACPNLVVLKLNACTNVTQKAAVSIAEACPKLEKLWITGHDKSRGAIKPKALLKVLGDRQELVPNLRELGLYDQNGDLGMGGDSAISKLSKKRGRLAIMSGETTADRYSGCAVSSTIYNGKVVDMDVDGY